MRVEIDTIFEWVLSFYYSKLPLERAIARKLKIPADSESAGINFGYLVIREVFGIQVCNRWEHPQ